jgi:hypothetical protein
MGPAKGSVTVFVAAQKNYAKIRQKRKEEEKRKESTLM